MQKMGATERREIELVFWRELTSSNRQAYGAYDRLLEQPDDRDAIASLGSFFHSLAGTAEMVGLPVLGHLAGAMERLADLLLHQGSVSSNTAAAMFREALNGVEAAIAARAGETAIRIDTLAGPARELGIEESDVRALLASREKAKILVVDDDRVGAEMVDRCLLRNGFASSFLCDSRRALEVIEREIPDLLVLDVMMPGIDGFELCRRVREHPALQLTPIIFVTRKGDVDQRVRGLEVGGNDYIAKPFEPQELVARVRSHLTRLAALREMAIRDGLTRCYNHKHFRARLEPEVERADRVERPLTLAMLDVDDFKAVNDVNGHRFGDLVLVHMGSLIMAETRATDVVARYGGDEFAILMPNTGGKEAKVVCTRLCARVAAHAFYADAEPAESSAGEPPHARIEITASIGLATLEPGERGGRLIKRADDALYAAKRAGRNRVLVSGRLDS